MYHAEASIVINRPMTDVFKIVSNLSRAKEWQAGLVESNWTSDRDPGIGTTYQFVTKFAGSRMELPGEITSWDPPNGLQWKASGGPFPVQGGYRLKQVDNSTRITMFSDSEPKGWMNAMKPILKWMGERTYKQSLAHLKMILES